MEAGVWVYVLHVWRYRSLLGHEHAGQVSVLVGRTKLRGLLEVVVLVDRLLWLFRGADCEVWW